MRTTCICEAHIRVTRPQLRVACPDRCPGGLDAGRVQVSQALELIHVGALLRSTEKYYWKGEGLAWGAPEPPWPGSLVEPPQGSGTSLVSATAGWFLESTPPVVTFQAQSRAGPPSLPPHPCARTYHAHRQTRGQGSHPGPLGSSEEG